MHQVGTAVSARGWGWRHAGRRTFAVAHLDLEIGPGEKVLLLGASGSGKSTLMHGLAGVLGGDDEGDAVGELLVDGCAPERARGRVGLVLQDPDSQIVQARVGDDVAFGCENLGVPREQIWSRVREALDAVGLDLPLDAATSTLSGGQKQRLALAGTLAMRPGLVLLDEPTANLDPEGVGDVRDAVARSIAASGATLVVVEHRVDVWLELVDRVIVLEPGGGVLADGPPERVLHERHDRLVDAGVWLPGARRLDFVALPSPGAELLEADELAVGRTPFGSRTARAAAEHIAFAAREGACLAITGPNGAGKSTLALTAAGLLRPLSGRLDATPVLAAGAGTSPSKWRSSQLLTRIGTVFQDPEHQFLTASVRDELAVGPRALRQDAALVRDRVDELMQRLRLDHVAQANPFTLSGGEKRRLSVATALATRPGLLVLDEPTFGQDARTWAELIRLLRELLAEGTGVMAVTHDAEFVEALAGDRVTLHTRAPAQVRR
jgi:energy-coupling factor transport system ATP-binding protein